MQSHQQQMQDPSVLQQQQQAQAASIPQYYQGDPSQLPVDYIDPTDYPGTEHSPLSGTPPSPATQAAQQQQAAAQASAQQQTPDLKSSSKYREAVSHICTSPDTSTQ
ncbi:unnamed protein product [Ambrosiozyma monospora]|uniref:Unnamed protein product n=1 Tax=Ambrosiozyma monospora TaxID=43982 RepID=A0ACB5TVW7_AMBMO|nr:unnamed protein product [Ambrosiozyma monospora]